MTLRRVAGASTAGQGVFEASAFGAYVLLIALGCRPARQPPAAPQPQPPRAPVKLLVIDEPEVADRIQELWQTRGEGSLNIATADMAQSQSGDEVWTGADVVVFPMELLGDFLSEGRIVPFVEGALDEPSYRWREVADALRRRVVVWDRTVYAVPMGAATPLFWYRADIWERHGWQPPMTWRELSDRLEKLREQGDGKLGWSVEPLAEGWAARTLLARASAYALHPSYLAVLFHPDTMDALIDGPPFIEALEELVHDAAPESLELGPGQVVLWAHEHGHAVAIGWWPKAADATSDWQQLWNVHTLPAADKAYDRHNQRWEERPEARQSATFAGYAGLLAAVTRQARNQRAAANFVTLITGPDWGASLAAASRRTAPWRESQTQQLDAWFAESADLALRSRYVTRMLDMFNSTRVLLFPPIRGQPEYLAALDDAIRKAVRKEATPEAALREAAAVWNSITDRMGRQEQQQAYRKALGF